MKFKSDCLKALLLLLVIACSFACKKTQNEVADWDAILHVEVFSRQIPPYWFPEGAPVQESMFMVARKDNDNSVLGGLVRIAGFTPEGGYKYVLKVKKTGNVIPGTTATIENDFSLVSVVSKDKMTGF